MTDLNLPTMCMKFDVRDEQDMRNMAIITAEWVKQGVVFTVERWDDNHYRVALTGGF